MKILMPKPSIIRSVLLRVAYNLEFLRIKARGLLIRIVPCKVFLIETLALFHGLMSLFTKFNQWKVIARFAKHTGSVIPGWLYILKYFIQRGRDNIWGVVYCEAGSGIKKYFTVENRDLIEQAVEEGKGAILVGAHLGPSLYAVMFHELNIDIRMLASKKFTKYIEEASEFGMKSLISNKVKILKDAQLTLRAGKSERELIQHLRKGGVVAMHIDFPSHQKQEGVVSDFFGMPMRFNYFPFKLSLSYNAPVFFYYFNKDKNSGYKLSFSPCGNFSTPEEGIKKYSFFFQKHIISHPFMWNELPEFFSWFPNSTNPLP